MNNHNLSARWIKTELVRQNGLRIKLLSVYNNMNDQNTDYAQGILKMYRMRSDIVSVIEKYGKDV